MSQLPQGWEIKKFTDVFDINGGTQPPKSEFISEPKEGYIRLLQIRDFGAKPVPTYIPDNGKRRTCTEDDILIGRYGASVGRICTGMSGAYNVALAKVAKPDYIDTGYLKYFLKSDVFQRPLSMLSRSAQNGFNKKDLSTFDFYQPPLEDQKRIADKLDSVLAKVESAQARLDKIPTILKRFRQSVLAAATSGELTKDWHDENEIDDWQHVSLKDVGSAFNYGSSSKSQKEGKVPVLRMGNLQNGKLDWTDLVYSSDDTEINKYKLEPGDVLFNRTNSPELVGKTSIYRGEREAIYAGYLIKVQGSDKLNSEYLNIQLNSPHAKDYCWKVKTDGVSQSNINAKKLQAYEFDLPPINEQLEIVRRVDELLAHSDTVERQYNAAKARLDKLTQSILARAFRGDLFLPLSESTAINLGSANSANSSEKADSIESSADLVSGMPKSSTVDTSKADQVSATGANDKDLEFEKESKVLKLLRANKKSSRSAQEIFDINELNTFETIDNIFIELKKLLKLNLIEQLGNGINTKFKAK